MIQTSTKPAGAQRDLSWQRFEQFQNAGAAGEPGWLKALRKQAISQFAESGLPTIKNEDWRFTNVAPLAKVAHNPFVQTSLHAVTPAFVNGLPLSTLQGSKLVFVDGQFAPELSSVSAVPAGVRITNIAAALDQDPDFVEKYLGHYAQSGHNPFAALNLAFFTDGAFIHVPVGVVMTEPVQLLHIATSAQSGATTHPRHLIVAEDRSQLTVVETYLGTVAVASLTATPRSDERGYADAGTTHLTNAVTEIVLGTGAKVEQCKFQDEGAAAYHIGTNHAHLTGRSDLVSHSFALGAKLSRNNIRTTLSGPGIECVLNGLYLTKDDQLADHHMIVEHRSPNCNSHEYFNGILDGHSRGVFHGRILVQQAAQKTDAKQTNKNLLLSDDAGVNTKPQLEIYADDVKCTHGATIGQLNPESIFYLRARGIGQETARRMLMHGFAGEIIERIRCEPVREELDKLVWDRLEQNQLISVKSSTPADHV